jgi:hypothetical protein
VSAARSGTGTSLLLTYSVEIRSDRRVALQRVIGVMLPAVGSAVEVQEPARWLCLADTGHAVPVAGLWRERFVCWAPSRQPEADAIATTAMERVAAELATSNRERCEVEASTLARWLQLRANEICGVSTAGVGDLFDADRTDSTWRSLTMPIDRLAGYAADGSNPTARRREASNVVELYLRRSKDLAETLVPELRPIGILMLVPFGSARDDT